MVVAVALAAPPRVQAASLTWDGGGADNNWSTPVNWSSDLVPGVGDTVVFDSTSTKSATIDVATSVLGISINAGYTGTITVSRSLAITGDLAINAGTLSGTENVTIQGGDVTGDGTITLTRGTFTVQGTGSFGGATVWTFADLTFGDGATTATTTATGSGGITVSGTLTIRANHTLDAGSKTWTLSGSWWDTGWLNRIKLVFDNSASAENLANFPVLIVLNSSRIDYAKTQNSGQDLRFVDEDGTVLAHEIEKWDETGTSYVWVKVPQVDASSSADSIWLYYNNTSAADGQQATAIWDANFKGVWHLKETTGGAAAVKDSTSEANHGTDTNGLTLGAVGKTGNAVSLDGLDDYLRVPDSASLDGTNDEGTFGLWIKWTNAADGNSQFVMSSSNRFTAGANDGYEWASQGTGNHFYYPWSGDGNNYNLGVNPFTNGAWHHLIVTQKFSTREVKIYVDGNPMTFTTVNVPTLWTTLASPADWLWGGNPDRPTRSFTGLMDEIRVSDVARSAAWIAAEYKAGADTFNTYDSEQAQANGQLAISGTFTANSSSVTYTTSGSAFVPAATYNNLTANGAGTYTLAGNLTLDNNLTISQGTVDVSTSNYAITVGGSWTDTGAGAFTEGSGTVTLDGGAATIDVVTNEGFNNLTIDSTGTKTVAASDTLIVAGTLTLTDGSVNQTTIPAGGTLAARGAITQGSGFDGGTGLLLIDGTGNQTFTGGGSATAGDLPDVTINKSAGTVTLSSTIRTTNDWTYTAGAVDPDSSTVVFAGTLTIDAGAMAFAAILVNAGTATLAANLTATGDLTVAAGTLEIGSNTVFVAGDVTVDGGLTVTTGTLDMNGLTGQILGGAATIGLYGLTINDAAGVTQTTTVSVAGTLDLGGPLTFNGQSLSIAHAMTGAPNNLAGDATSTLTITGTGSGIIIPASLAAVLNLSIDNPNGAALAGPLTVVGTFTLAGGNLNAGSDVLSIGPAGSVSRTSGHVVGALEKWVPVGSGVTVTYEIGDATTYAPVSLTFGTVGITGQLIASTTPGEHPSLGTSPIDPAHNVNRWWTLTNAGVGFDTLDASFTFAPADVDPGAQTSQFIVAKWDGSWATPASGANTATTITASGMTSLSEFAVGEVAADLSSLPDSALTIWTPGGIGALPLVFSAWVLLLLTLAIVSARGPRARR